MAHVDEKFAIKASQCNQAPASRSAFSIGPHGMPFVPNISNGAMHMTLRRPTGPSEPFLRRLARSGPRSLVSGKLVNMPGALPNSCYRLLGVRAGFDAHCVLLKSWISFRLSCLCLDDLQKHRHFLYHLQEEKILLD